MKFWMEEWKKGLMWRIFEEMDKDMKQDFSKTRAKAP